MVYGFGISSEEGVYLNEKKQLVCQFFQVIQGLSFDLDKEDSWIWKGGEVVSYIVNSTYNRLRGDWEGEDTTIFK